MRKISPTIHLWNPGFRVVSLVLLTLIGTACSFRADVRLEPDSRPAVPVVDAAVTGNSSAEVKPASQEAISTDVGSLEEFALIWEGDPDLGDGRQDICRSLRLVADQAQALIGPCGGELTALPLLANHDQWTEMAARFAPFQSDSPSERITFRGRGQIASPAWERAITGWARFTYLELSAGRVSGSVRTVMSWWPGELPEQPGFCRHLLVLAHGYAYSSIAPCTGGPDQNIVGGWLETEEMERFDAWLYNRTPLYQENNYFSGQGAAEMSQAEAAALSQWAEAVYARLAN